MTDSELRRLERAFRASGSVEDEAAWLRARGQAGELEQAKLELAGYLGHESAGLAFTPPLNSTDCEAALLGQKWDDLVAARFATAAARVALAVYEGAQPHDTRPGACLRAVEEWVACPCAYHRVRVEAATNPTADAFLESQFPPPEPSQEVTLAAYSVHCSALAIVAGTRPRGWAVNAMRSAEYSLASKQAVAAAVARDLVPWLLGYSDPVRERVEVRQREAAGE